MDMEENMDLLQNIAQLAKQIRRKRELCKKRRKCAANAAKFVESNVTQGTNSKEDSDHSSSPEGADNNSSEYGIDPPFAYSVVHPVATNELILCNMFGFLDVASLQLCRQVCSHWKRVCQPAYAEKAKLRFFSNQGSIVQYLETFQGSETFPCHHVKFDTAHYVSSDIIRLLEANANHLYTLELDNITIQNEPEVITPLPLIDFNFSVHLANLQKIEISSYGNTLINVPLNLILSLENISLSNCQVIFPTEAEGKLCPKVLEFNFVTYLDVSGQKPDFITLNDFIDFKNIRVLKINKNISNPTMQVDFEPYEDVPMDNVELNHVYVAINYRNKVRRLKIACITKFDVAWLPASLEVFQFEKGILCVRDRKEGQLLPNLKSFFWEIVVPPIFCPDLTRCRHLTEVKINSLLGTSVTLSLSWLPRHVNKLAIGKSILLHRSQHIIPFHPITKQNLLSQWNVIWTPKSHFRSMCLMGHNWGSVSDIVNHCTFDHLTINLKHPEGTNGLDEHIQVFRRILHLPVKSIVIGKFNWDTTSQFAAHMGRIVDKMANYYCFKNGRGKSMPKKVFNRHLELLGYKKEDFMVW